MADIISILPDFVANQIAAGEVIQRPASAVKELLENAIDAGATEIELIVKDAGRTLIQIIDNGSGMSDTDARMCFERHATSKIKETIDLFAIHTMGFRGEALASIAAVAQVELKSKRIEDELGTFIEIEGSEVKKQQSVSTPNGTSFALKNLFYNVPARRNFLKTEAVELKHIFEELYRVALAYPAVAFTFHHDNKLLLKLESSNLRQRIINIFGTNYNERLLPVEQTTDIISIKGFIGKPEFARKTRGEQYFFVNNRFIKHPYFGHAIDQAFQGLVPENSFPTYFIFFEVDPKIIDINIHPTKTEVKFQDERTLYAILMAAVKKSIGTHNITPSIDFEVEKSFDIPYSYKDKPIVAPTVRFNPDYNPFRESKAGEQQRSSNEKLLADLKDIDLTDIPKQATELWNASAGEAQSRSIFQIQNRYIVSHIKSGLVIIDQQRAHERILYESFLEADKDKTPITQQQLFPKTIELPPHDAELLKQIKGDLANVGFDIEEFGSNAFIVNGIPQHIDQNNIADVIETLLEEIKNNLSEYKDNKQSFFAKAVATRLAVKAGKKLQPEEMQNLIDKLFACKAPYYSPGNKPTVIIITFDEMISKFK